MPSFVYEKCENFPNCKEYVSKEGNRWYEVDVKNHRVTSVEHNSKRCEEIARCRQGKKPLPVGQTTLKLFEDWV